MAALLEALLADDAVEGRDVGVRAHVLLQVHRLAKGLAAHHALVWLVLGVDAQMLLQPRFLREGLGAEGALVRPVPGVTSHVLHEAAMLREPFGAEAALERLHFRVVHAHVVRQLLAAFEAHAAELQNEQTSFISSSPGLKTTENIQFNSITKSIRWNYNDSHQTVSINEQFIKYLKLRTNNYWNY